MFRFNYVCTDRVTNHLEYFTCLWHVSCAPSVCYHLSNFCLTAYKTTTILLDGKRVKLQLWDTSGQGRFCTIIRSYSRGAQGILLVYDITNKWSFDGINRWLKEVEEVRFFLLYCVYEDSYVCCIRKTFLGLLFAFSCNFAFSVDSMPLVCPKCWLGIDYTWHLNAKLPWKKLKPMQQNIRCLILKWAHYVTLISVKALVNCPVWHCIEMAWKDYGDPIRCSVFKSCVAEQLWLVPLYIVLINYHCQIL